RTEPCDQRGEKGSGDGQAAVVRQHGPDPGAKVVAAVAEALYAQAVGAPERDHLERRRLFAEAPIEAQEAFRRENARGVRAAAAAEADLVARQQLHFLDQAAPGRSFLAAGEYAQRARAQHRGVGPGDVATDAHLVGDEGED